MNYNEIVEVMKLAYRLKVQKRYNHIPRIYQESVSEHSYEVCLASVLLADAYLREHLIDFKKLVRMAVVHDLAEVRVADIPHDTKTLFPKFAAELQRLECKVLGELLHSRDWSFLLSEYNDKSSIEALIVNLADVLSCKVYAENELAMGNTNFARVLQESDCRIVEIKERLDKL